MSAHLWFAVLAGCIPTPVPPTVDNPVHDYDEDGFSENAGDCDDNDLTVYPGAPEICGDGIDNGCTGSAGGCGVWGDVSADEADLVLQGGTADGYAGTAIDAGHDLDGDGLADILVGAPNVDGHTGRVYLAMGAGLGESQLDAEETLITGDAPEDWFGESVAWVGDYDGDGVADYAVGAPEADTQVDPGTAGRVDLFTGTMRGQLGPSDAFATFAGEEGAVVGMQLAGGDTDGDGIDDVLVGAEFLDDPYTNAGGVYLLRGPIAGELGPADASAVFLGESEGSLAGGAVTPPVDLDGDGIAEILVGAVSATYEDVIPGAVYVLDGNSTGVVGLADAKAKLTGDMDQDRVGNSLASTDVDADGYIDVLIGSPSVRDGERGAIYVVAGPVTADLELAGEAKLVGEAEMDDLGDNLAAPGDVDGDGRGDVLAASVDHLTSESDEGVVYLVYGPIVGTLDVGLAAGARIVATGRGAFGESLSGGDVWGDGVADIAIGAPLAEVGSTRGGAVYLFEGGSP